MYLEEQRTIHSSINTTSGNVLGMFQEMNTHISVYWLELRCLVCCKTWSVQYFSLYFSYFSWFTMNLSIICYLLVTPVSLCHCKSHVPSTLIFHGVLPLFCCVNLIGKLECTWQWGTIHAWHSYVTPQWICHSLRWVPVQYSLCSLLILS